MGYQIAIGNFFGGIAGGISTDLIGIAGERGFGVGVASTLSIGMTALAGTTDTASDEYGNYQFEDGSIMVYVPKFFYKVGTGLNGFAVNVIDVKGIDTYATTALANAAGYALHRAFIDGGSEKKGFFFDKYEASKNAKGTGFVASSIKNGLPISTNAAHNPISDLTAVTVNQYYSTVDAAHARDGANGAVNPDSIFSVGTMYQYSALAMLSMAHGQAANDATNCAWYDVAGNTNFPKGNNNNALKDVNDTSVVWESDGYSNAGKTGSAGYGGGAGNEFAKSAHNGQINGIVDLSGNLYEVSLGLTRDGANSDFYSLKESVAAKNMTSGYGGATDWWGDTTSLANTHDVLSAAHITNASAWERFGNGENQVLSAATSGEGWLLTGLGLPLAQTAQSAVGTNLFGTDGLFEYWRAQLCPIVGGNWGDSRASSFVHVGFRCSTYGD